MKVAELYSEVRDHAAEPTSPGGTRSIKRPRVVIWTTGKVGKHALRAVLDNRAQELVGVYSFSPEKVGVDAGTLCGRPDTEIRATNSIDEILALNADVVVYTPFTGDVDDVVTLLESGANVLSTNLFFHVGGIRGAVKDRFEAACQRGSSSIYITGINPGWAGSMATALTGISSRVDCVSIYESANCEDYKSPETWSYFHMGQQGATPEVIDSAKTWMIMFKDAAERLGQALGLTFDDLDFFCDYATASERVDLGWFVMEQGTNAAIRARWEGKVKGKTRVRVQVIWYLTTKLAEGWDLGSDTYHMVVDGAPNIDTRINITAPAPDADGPWSATSTTSLVAVNAIEQIMAARPGVLSMHDIGLPFAPTGDRES